MFTLTNVKPSYIRVYFILRSIMAAFKSQLKALTRDQKQKAFEKARDGADFTEGQLVLVTEEYYPKAIDFMRTNFSVQEQVEKVLGLQWNDEVEEFWMTFFRWNISLMFLADNGDVMAIRVSRFLCYDEESDDDDIKNRELRLFEQFCHIGDTRANFFGHFGAKECIHFFGLGTSDEYRHRHLATRIFKAAVNMAKHLGVEYIKGEGSNVYSQRIYENADFELLYEEPFHGFEVDGVKPLQSAEENATVRFYGLKVSSKKEQ